MQTLEVSPAIVIAALIIAVFIGLISTTFLKYPYDKRIKIWGTGWLILSTLATFSVIVPSNTFGVWNLLAVIGIVLGSTVIVNGSIDREVVLFPWWVYAIVMVASVAYGAVCMLLQIYTSVAFILPELYGGIAALFFLRAILNHTTKRGAFVWLIVISTLGWTITAFGVASLLILPPGTVKVYLSFQGAFIGMIILFIYGRSVELSHETLSYQNRLALLLASVIHHDIRNYIQILRQSLELARLDEVKHRDWLSVAAQVAENVATFLEEVREATSEIARYQKVEREMDLSKVVSSILEFFSRVYLDKKVKIVNRVEEAQMVYSNDLLRQIIYNIIDNAIKHGTTLLKIGTKSDNRHIVLYIEDRAGGLPQAPLDYINKPGELSKAPGVGLGLILIKGLAPLCQVEVHAENVYENGQPVGCRYNLEFIAPLSNNS